MFRNFALDHGDPRDAGFGTAILGPGSQGAKLEQLIVHGEQSGDRW
jgi:hypothetical protein